ncbi:MAG: glycoside hydrolase family 95 protein, partial [Clostridiales bacterium]|nr:glycoside hydrolase family 95 protein [Clostridiales bacterium]
VSGGIAYTREVIASNPDEVILIRIKADKEKSISIRIGIDGRDDYFDSNSPIDENTIHYFGGMGGEDGINFSSYIKTKASGGECKIYGNYLACENCDEVVIAVSCRTDYRHENYRELALLDCENALSKTFDQLNERHISDYKSFYNRCDLKLEDNSNGASKLPTNERLENIKNDGEDNKLVEMYFNFGRYLMISGSRQGTLPLNLQGIWNENMWPAWGGKYTININTEMNYWPVEICNLSELHQPLFDIVEKMRPNGRITAKEMYNCGGFVAHHNTDLWGDTAPQDLWMPGTQWPMGAAWLCTHIWEHYKFTQDKEFLKDKYETLKEATDFFVDFLIEDKKGRLVTCPSVSPENTYLTESNTQGAICAGPSMDSQILFELFTAVIESADILGVRDEYTQKLEEIRERIPKPEIGKYGQIKEWAEDYDEVEPGHRHISQLFALYPSDMISMRKTPELASAARATLERRLSHGGGHTGWSRAWIINHWARLFEGEKVHENIKSLLSASTNPNMFDSHPPFQIDGNFGGTAGIAEAVLQSENGEIILLPALPAKWSNGEFRGLKARGGFEISAKWENEKIICLSVKSLAGSVCKIVSKEILEVTYNGKPVPVKYINGATVFETLVEQEYQIS